MKNYAIYGLLILALVLPIATRAQTTNLDELTTSLFKQIESLKQQINQLQEQLSKIEQQVQEIVKFTKTLQKGTTDEEVKRLQEFLKTDPEVYPEGLITGYYGSLTERAVKKFQEKHADDVLEPLGLSEGTGVFGPKTIETMNKILDEAGKSGKIPPGLLRNAEETSAASVHEEKAIICHIPDGNTTNKQTITVSKSALEAHLAHGDVIGVCLAETIPPSIPTNFSAIVISIDQIFLSWNASTDNVGVIGYKIYRGGAQMVTNALSYSDTGLQASTAYTYTIAAYDAAGNMSAQSNPVSATTLPVNTLPTASAPTDINLGWWKTAGENASGPPIGQYQQGIHFSYGGDIGALQSFKVYLKRPGESSFTIIATFSNPASLIVTSGCSSQNINSGVWSIHYCVVKPINPSSPPYSWQVLGSVGVASIYPVGEYDAYVTAVNTAGVEGPASNVASNVVAKATLLSPIGVQESLTPTFYWTVPGGLPPINYNAILFTGPDIMWNGFMGASAETTDMSVTYDGPALDPSKIYYAHVYGEANGYMVMGDSSPTFTVSYSY